MTAPGSLGPLQWQILTTLASHHPDPLTTTDMGWIGPTNMLGSTLAKLEKAGLAEKTGTRPGKPKPSNLWTVTEAGRARATKGRHQ